MEILLIDALSVIMDAQQEIAKTIPIPLVGQTRRGDLRMVAQVDLTDRHYAGHGQRNRRKEELKKAKQEHKLTEGKLRRNIYEYNFNGIAEHGLAFNHMNAHQKREWFKRLVMSDARIPQEALQWGRDRGLI